MLCKKIFHCIKLMVMRVLFATPTNRGSLWGGTWEGRTCLFTRKSGRGTWSLSHWQMFKFCIHFSLRLLLPPFHVTFTQVPEKDYNRRWRPLTCCILLLTTCVNFTFSSHTGATGKILGSCRFGKSNHFSIGFVRDLLSFPSDLVSLPLSAHGKPSSRSPPQDVCGSMLLKMSMRLSSPHR